MSATVRVYENNNRTLDCRYTDGQKCAVSVPWQYLLTDIVHDDVKNFY